MYNIVMISQKHREAVYLFFGDILILYFSLFVALSFRYFSIPSYDYFYLHLLPFSIIIIVWLLVFFIGGIYEKHTLILKSRLPSTVLNAQLINSFIAVLFFYFIPYFGIAPKTNLFIYLIISFIFILTWRIYGDSLFRPSIKQRGLIIGGGDDMKELINEVNNNPKYGLEFISSVDINKISGVDFNSEILNTVYSEDIQIIAVDLKNEKVDSILPHLYNLIFSRIKFIDMYKIYEDIFDRVPISLVKYNWFLENISTESRVAYDFLKRMMDILLSLIIGLISLIFYPIVYILIKIEDRGPIFFEQERIGKNNKVFKLKKFRSMSILKENETEQKITSVGRFLRASRIDELPQLWSVFTGDMSLIGPRPEIPNLVKHYESEISYYDVRHLIKPGLSGWAQLYHTDPPKISADAEKTRRKLSYDLYYIKNRSLILDLKIALKTLKTLLSRSGI